MSKIALSVIGVILAMLFVVSLVVFAVFPLNNIDIRNHTVQTTVEDIKYIPSKYNNGLDVYTSQDFNLPYRAILIGITVEFEYSNLNTSLEFFNQNAKTSVYLIYDITSQLDENTISIIFDNYDRRYFYIENYLFNSNVTLNMDYFYKGYLLPVYFLDKLLTNSKFDFYKYFSYNQELPNLTPVRYFPIAGQYYIDSNHDTIFSYSVPLSGWGYSGFDVGTRSYMGNVVTVFDFTLFNLTSLFDITNLSHIDSIVDLVILIKDIVLFPIHIVEMAYALVTAFTFNLVFI